MTENGKKRVSPGVAILLIAVIVMCLFTMTACNQETVTALEIKEAPQVVVVGQFQISNVILAATDDAGNVKEVPASNSMLTTDGRLALQTPGQQNVSIHYKGQVAVWGVLVVDENTEIVEVTFKDREGNLLEKKSVVKGGSVTPPDAPAVEGLQFAGWITDTGATPNLNSVTENLTLTADYAENITMHTVTFVDYKGNVVATVSVRHGNKVTAPAYSVGAELESFSWEWDFNNPITSNITINMTYKLATRGVQYAYAFESRPEVTYNLTAFERVDIGSAPTASTRNAALTEISGMGMEFIEWRNNVTAVNTDVVIVAIVKDITFTIKYNCNIDDSVVASGAKHTLPTGGVTADYGYAFTGEWDDLDTENVVEHLKGEIEVRRNMNLAPVFEKQAVSVVLTYEFEGDVDADPIVINLEKEFADFIDLDVLKEEYDKYVEAHKDDAKYAGIALDKYDIEQISYHGNTSANSAVVDIDITATGVELGYNVDRPQNFTIRLVNSDLLTVGLKAEVISVAEGEATTAKIIKEADDADTLNKLSNRVIHIPETVAIEGKTYQVVELGEKLFEFDSGKLTIAQINIPATVKKLGNRVFANTVLSTDIVLPALEECGAAVFDGVTTPEGTTISVIFDEKSTVSSLNGDMFRGSKGITKVVLPSSVETIGDYAEDYDEAKTDEIEEINLDSVKTIGSNVFAHSPLVNVGSLEKVETIGEHAFCKTLLESIVLTSVTAIGDGAFGLMPNLVSIDIKPQDGAKDFEFDIDMVKGCDKLETITLGEGVEAFLALDSSTYASDTLLMPSLKTVNLPASLVRIGKNKGGEDFDYQFFVDLRFLTAINVAADNAKYASVDGVLFDIAQRENEALMVAFPAGMSGNYIMPGKVKGKTAAFEKGLDFGKVELNTFQISAETLDFMLTNEEEYRFATWTGGRVENLLLDGNAIVESGKDLNNLLIELFTRLNGKIDDKVKPNEKTPTNLVTNLYFDFGTNEANATALMGAVEAVGDAKDKINVELYTGGTQLSKYYHADATGDRVAIDLIYKIDGENATILFGDNTASTIIIPETVDGYKVVAIAEGAFSGYINLVTLMVEAKLNGLPQFAFDGCSNLEFITVAGWADGVTSDDLDSTALYGTKYVYDTHIMALGGLLFAHDPEDGHKDHDSHDPDHPIDIAAEDMPGVKEIPAGFFMNADYLGNVVLPESVTIIGENAFAGSSIKSINLENVENIGNNAFKDCANLKEIRLDKCTTMGTMVFAGCTSLETAIINSRTGNRGYLPAGTFYKCSSLKNVDMPEIVGLAPGNVKYDEEGGELQGSYAFAESGIADIGFIARFGGIPAYAFESCSNIKHIDFRGSAVTSVGVSAFQGCNELLEVVIPSSVTFLGADAFKGTTSLKSVKFVGQGGIFSNNQALPITQVFDNQYTDGHVFNYYCPQYLQAANSTVLATVQAYCRYTFPTLHFALHEDNIIEIGSAFSMLSVTDEVFVWEAPVAPEITGYVFDAWYYRSDKETGSYVQLRDKDYPKYYGGDESNGLTLYARYYSLNRGTLEDTDVDVDNAENPSYYILKRLSNTESINIPAYFDGPYGLLPIKKINLAIFDIFNEANKLHEDSLLTEIVIPEGVEIISIPDTFNKGGEITSIVLPTSLVTIEGVFPDTCSVLDIVFPEECNLIYADLETFANTGWYQAQRDYAEGQARDYKLNTFIMAGGVLIEVYSVLVDIATQNVVMMDNDGTRVKDFTQIVEEVQGKIEDGDYILDPAKSDDPKYTGDPTDRYLQENGYQYASTEYTLPENTVRIGKGVFAPHMFTSKDGKGYEIATAATRARVNKRITTLIVNDGLKYIHVTEDTAYGTDDASKVKARYECAFAYSSLQEVRYASGNNVNMQLLGGDARAFRNTPWLNSETSTFVILGTTLVRYNDHGLTRIDMPDYITEIARGAFGDASSLQEINFSNTSQLKKIGDGAFQQAGKLTSITLPAITEMGENVFADCGSLVTVDMSKTLLTTLPAGTFSQFVKDSSGCANLTTLILPDCMTTLAEHSLTSSLPADQTTYRPTSLVNITANGLVGDENLYNELKGTGFYKNAKRTKYTVLGKVLVKYTSDVQQNVDEDEPLNADIDEEGEESEIEIADIPEGVEYVLNYAFTGSSVVRVNVPTSVKVFGNYSFSSQYKVGDGDNASIAGSDHLTDVIFNEGVPTLTEIGDNAFQSRKSLCNFVLPESVRKVGANAFAETGLIEAYIPNGVQEIGEEAYADIATLETIALGSGLKFIGESAFAGNPKLYRIDWSMAGVDFDKLMQNIVEENEDIPDFEREGVFATYISGLFAKPVVSGGVPDRRLYLSNDLYQYINGKPNVNGKEDPIKKAWMTTAVGEGCFTIRDGVQYPQVTLKMGVEDSASTLDIINAEKLTSLPTPSGSADQVFVGWYTKETGTPVDPSEEKPYYVYSDLTLVAHWFNKIWDLTGNTGLTFEETDGKAYLSSINLDDPSLTSKNILAGGTLYLPAMVRDTTGSHPVSGIYDTLTISGDGKITGLVLTEAAYFNGMTVNQFAKFPDLQEITLLSDDPDSVDMVVEDRIVYSADGTVLIAYLLPPSETGSDKDKKEEKTFEIREGVTGIIENAFANANLTRLTIPATVTAIGKTAFNDSLETIVFAEGIRLTDASKYSFNNTKWYNGEDGVRGAAATTPYGTNGYFYTAGNMLIAYERISDSRNLTLPVSATSEGIAHTITVLGEHLNFTLDEGSGSSKLVKYSFDVLILPTGLEKINTEAFKEINILQDIRAEGCNNLNDIAPYVFRDTDYYTSGNANSGMVIIGNVLLKCATVANTVDVPQGVVAIAARAFEGSQMTTVNLPEGLQYIGEAAFYGCPQLRSVTIPDSVVEIATSAFAVCANLVSFNINIGSSKLEKIGDRAFDSDRNLTTINLPYNLKSLGSSVFSKCRSLATITFDYYEDITNVEDGTVNRVIHEKSLLTEMGENVFESCLALREISIPDGVEEIKSYAFSGCSSLINVKFDLVNSKLRNIRSNAFLQCSKLGSVFDLTGYDPTNVETSNAISLVTLTLPNALVEIGNNAFEGCTGLFGVSLQYNVKSIGSDAFKNAKNLAKIDLHTGTPPTITETSFISVDDVRNYHLRIYVNDSLDNTILTEYRKGWSGVWSGVLNYLYARDEKPVVYFGEESTPHSGDIFVDPYYYQNRVWRYSEMTYYDINATSDYESLKDLNRSDYYSMPTNELVTKRTISENGNRTETGIADPRVEDNFYSTPQGSEGSSSNESQIFVEVIQDGHGILIVDFDSLHMARAA